MISEYDPVLGKEQNGLPQLPTANYELIHQQASANPDRVAMYFFEDGATFDQAISLTKYR